MTWSRISYFAHKLPHLYYHASGINSGVETGSYFCLWNRITGSGFRLKHEKKSNHSLFGKTLFLSVPVWLLLLLFVFCFFLFFSLFVNRSCRHHTSICKKSHKICSIFNVILKCFSRTRNENLNSSFNNGFESLFRIWQMSPFIKN